jgi:predicted nucleic acid-binding protein
MTGAVFVDSTTLLYTQDRRDPRKQERATAWLSALLRSANLVVSLQVLNETYAVVRRKPEFAHWRPDVRDFLTDQLAFTTRPLGGEDLQEAWRLEDRYRISYWDALLLTSANDADCAYFLSEDLNDGQVYGAVTAINPFRHAPADVLGPPLRT